MMMKIMNVFITKHATNNYEHTHKTLVLYSGLNTNHTS